MNANSPPNWLASRTRASTSRARAAAVRAVRGTMIVSLAIEYLGETHYPDPVEVLCAVEKVGRTSLTLVHVVRQNERVVAFARCVMVAVDRQGQAAPVPADFADWTLRP